MPRRKAKLVSRGVEAIVKYMHDFPRRNANNQLTFCTIFKTNEGAHIYLEVQPHQVREMLEIWTALDLSMSDRIVLYRLEPYHYHLTFEGLENIAV
jgi:hypothetical protein